MIELNMMLKSARRSESTAKPTVVNAPSKGLEDMLSYRSQNGVLLFVAIHEPLVG
jgi:hypothetical protein